ncbi:Polysaccharide pyruvyl transferase family protein WcaK [Sphingomonas sp. OK281]|nr:Polysaccharide pyruvyl transferase family protein WcaK [Sphingomonas sp. OK281]
MMRSLRIGLLWHQFGRPNLGVDALSRSNIAILRAAAAAAGAKPHFILFGKPGEDLTIADDIELGPFLRVRDLATANTRNYRNELNKCDLIVDICAGDGFTSIYGRFLFSLQAITKYLAIQSGRPLVFAPQTIGPFDSAWTRSAARWIFNRAKITFARDGMSSLAFKDLGVTAPLEEVIDVAFRLPFESAKVKNQGEVIKVGINVSGLLYRHGDRFGLTLDYPELNRRLITAFGAMPNTEVWLVSHVHHDAGDAEDDFTVINEIAQQFPGVKIAPKFENSEEAKSWIVNLDFFTGGRMHACIGAFSSIVPVMPIAYSRKFNGLFSTLNYPHVVDGRCVTTDEAMTMLIAGFNGRATLRDELVRSMAEIVKVRLDRYQGVMADILKELPTAA